MNQFLCALCVLCGLNLIAAPLQWTCDWPEAKSQTFSLYQGETATFEPTFRVNGRTVTNATIEAVWYQTNGMGNAWWKLDGATFAPSNDVGAAAYRFFVEARVQESVVRSQESALTPDPSALTPILYRANGTLRMLPSPGFEPSTVQLPARSLDFAAIDYYNAPWPAEIESATNSLSASLSSLVSRASQAATNYTDSAISAAGSVTPSMVTNIVNDIAPTPGNYATVSNRAMTALQEHQDISGKLDKHGGYTQLSHLPEGKIGLHIEDDAGVSTFDIDVGFERGQSRFVTHHVLGQGGLPNPTTYTNHFPSASGTLALDGDVAAAAAAATNYTDSAIGNLTAQDVGATSIEDVYRLIAGTNVVLVVTNYNSATHVPAMKLQHLDPQSGEYVTYWDETRRHDMTLTNAMQYTDAAMQTRAPRAWSGTTSGLGSEAPAGVTWISTPETVIAGGYEYEKVITSAGAVWVLASNGLTTGATTNSFFRVSASDGTELFSIEKTDSYLIGVSADDITRSGNTVTIPVNIVAEAHPYVRASTNLVNAVWVKEDEDGFSCPWATVSWSGTTGAYVATITCSQPQAFFYFEYMAEGVAKIKNSAKTEMTGGIIFNGTTYMPTVNGNKLEFVAQ